MKSRRKSSKRVTINYCDESTSDDEWFDYYKDIKPQKITWTETCERADGLPTLKSNTIEFPFVDQNTNTMYINFITISDPRIYFQREAKLILNEQNKIDCFLGYINKYIDDLSQRYYDSITDCIESMKIYPQSDYNVGDYCTYPTSPIDCKLVKIVKLDNDKRMFACQARVHTVNIVQHTHQDIDVLKLQPEVGTDQYVVNDGAVANKDLIFLISNDDIIGMSAKDAKLTVSTLLYKQLYLLSDGKYQNMQSLNKSIFKQKLKGIAKELRLLLISTAVGMKRTIKIKGVSEREYRNIYKKNLKKLYHLSEWKIYSKTSTLALSQTIVPEIFGNVTVDDGDRTISLDSVRFIYTKDERTFSTEVNICSKHKLSGATKGTGKDKREKARKKAKRKRDIARNNANANDNNDNND